MSEANLARFGVEIDRIDDAFRALLDGIEWQQDIRASDAIEWIGD
jgi:hypothetical protein